MAWLCRVVAIRCKAGQLSDELAALELDDCPIRMVALPDGNTLLLALGGGGLVRVDVSASDGDSPRLSVHAGAAALPRGKDSPRAIQPSNRAWLGFNERADGIVSTRKKLRLPLRRPSCLRFLRLQQVCTGAAHCAADAVQTERHRSGGRRWGWSNAWR